MWTIFYRKPLIWKWDKPQRGEIVPKARPDIDAYVQPCLFMCGSSQITRTFLSSAALSKNPTQFNRHFFFFFTEEASGFLQHPSPQEKKNPSACSSLYLQRGNEKTSVLSCKPVSKQRDTESVSWRNSPRLPYISFESERFEISHKLKSEHVKPFMWSWGEDRVLGPTWKRLLSH